MKRCWLTSLIKDQAAMKGLLEQLKRYGIETDGHFWTDDLEKMLWIAARDEILKDEVGLWIIYGSNEALEPASIKKGLGLLVITVQAQKGTSFPIVGLWDGPLPETQALPTPLRGIEWLDAKNPALAAKLVAKLHAPARKEMPDYYLDVYGNPQIGMWFEAGPMDGEWKGAIFAVEGADISFQAVGPRGMLPSHATLNYPMQGVKLKMGEHEYTGWAVQNPISEKESHFVKVTGPPDAIAFGELPEADEAELFTIRLV